MVRYMYIPDAISDGRVIIDGISSKFSDAEIRTCDRLRITLASRGEKNETKMKKKDKDECAENDRWHFLARKNRGSLMRRLLT